VQVSDLVRTEIGRRFAPADVADVERRFAATPLPFLEPPDRDRERNRVHLGILKLAEGDLTKLDTALRVAATDWRDVLVASGLGHSNWPEVLKAAGFPAP
jgi:hypothetical protein